MQLGARWAAVADILTEVFEDKYPADNIINTYLRAHKYIGSKDRRFIVEKVWDIIRHRCRLSFEAESLDVRKILMVYLKDEDLDLIFGADEYALSSLTKDEKNWLKNLEEKSYPAWVEAETPQWLFDKIKNVSILKSLNEPASADLRINTSSVADVIKHLQSEGLFFRPTPYSPIGIRSFERVNLNNCAAYQNGEVDVQDEASQIGAILAQPKPYEKIIDYCAGAGGKTLTMLYLMESKGKVFVHDANPKRMDALKDRACRLNSKSFEVIDNLQNETFNLFVVDAPCSGTGTWRRAPDAKFRLTPGQLAELTRVQAEILEKAYKHTSAGGRIVYMTCSVLEDEDEGIIQNFVEKHADVKAVDLRPIWENNLNGAYPFSNPYMAKFSPYLTQTDGFFVCVLQKK